MNSSDAPATQFDGSFMDSTAGDAAQAHDAHYMDASYMDAAVTPARVDFWPCTQTAQITGAKNETFNFGLIAVMSDFAIGADKHGLIANMEADAGKCQMNPGAYTCAGFAQPNDTVGGYDAVNGKLMGVCGSSYSPSQFANRTVVWGSVSTSTAGAAATVTSLTCGQTATLSFSSTNDTYHFTINYALYSVPTGESAIVGHQGVTVIDQFDNFAANVSGGANCSSFYTCTGMPSGTVTNDVFGNTFYDGKLLVVCQATYADTTLSETFTQGAPTARVIHWQ